MKKWVEILITLVLSLITSIIAGLIVYWLTEDDKIVSLAMVLSMLALAVLWTGALRK